MKAFKRICSISILCLIVFCIPCYAQTYSEGTFYYELNGDSITITGYFGRDAEITVPENIAGYPVNGIGSGAFAEAESVQVIHLPGTITEIGENAFRPGQQVIYADSHPANQTPSQGQSDYADSSASDGTGGSFPEEGESGQPAEEAVVITVGDVSDDPGNSEQPSQGPGSGIAITLFDDEEADTTLPAEKEEAEEKLPATTEEPASASESSATEKAAQTQTASSTQTTSSDKATAADDTSTKSATAEKATTAVETTGNAVTQQNTGSRTAVIIIVIACICAAVIIGVVLKKRKR